MVKKKKQLCVTSTDSQDKLVQDLIEMINKQEDVSSTTKSQVVEKALNRLYKQLTED